MADSAFAWPDGRRAAVSLTFDDARGSQIDVGMPILDRWGVKASFYVTISNVRERVDDWKRALADGHEIANHTASHPCSGNFRFSRHNALEDYTLERMERELIDASDMIDRLVGVRPTTFAYPCGQTWVGRGAQVQSYVPLVARHFRVGRGYPDEAPSHPAVCDLARINGVGFDEMTPERAAAWIDQAVAEGGWLAFVGHDVGPRGRESQMVHADTLEAVCRICRERDSDVWIDTVDRIGAYIESARQS